MVGQDVRGRFRLLLCWRSVILLRDLLRRPQSEMAQNLADYVRILDEGDYAHLALAFRALERIDFVDLVAVELQDAGLPSLTMA